MSEPPLAYTLQRGVPWRTVKRYEAERYEFSTVQRVMALCRQRSPRYRWRIVLMPFNVLADEA